MNPSFVVCLPVVGALRSEGSIPPALGGLTRLQYLNLGKNQLSGEWVTEEPRFIHGTFSTKYRVLQFFDAQSLQIASGIMSVDFLRIISDLTPPRATPRIPGRI